MRRYRRGVWGSLLAIAAASFAIRIGCGGSAPESSVVSDAGWTDAGTGAAPPAGAAPPVDAASPDAGSAPPEGSTAIGPVFVIAMENRDANEIYGNFEDAPFINGTLMPRYAHATAFGDVLPDLPSEPHYLLIEAGTNTFFDHTFANNDNPSPSNSTAETAHLVTQIATAGRGLGWMSYQEGINEATGRCPIESDGFYRPRHNPFVFFHDVAGNPPSQGEPSCAAHHRDVTALAADLSNGNVATYSFITPDLCHGMHGAPECPSSNAIRAGDDWLAANLPPLIEFVHANGGVIFIFWEEGHHTATVPFLAVGPDVKPGYAGAVPYTHRSLLKTVEKLFGLPILPTVAGSTDLGDLFQP